MNYKNVHVSAVLTAQSVTSNFKAHISGKVETFCIVLLSVSSWTCLPIFLLKSVHILPTQSKKNSWHVFFLRHGVDITVTKRCIYLYKSKVLPFLGCSSAVRIFNCSSVISKMLEFEIKWVTAWIVSMSLESTWESQAPFNFDNSLS